MHEKEKRKKIIPVLETMFLWHTGQFAHIPMVVATASAQVAWLFLPCFVIRNMHVWLQHSPTAAQSPGNFFCLFPEYLSSHPVTHQTRHGS